MVTSGSLKEETSSNTDDGLGITTGFAVGDELGKRGWNVKLMAEGAKDIDDEGISI